MTIPIFVVSGRSEAKRIFECGKFDILMSYWYIKHNPKPILENIKQDRITYSSSGIFMLDSGAYSAWLNGFQISLFDYIDFIKKHHSYFTHIVCLDVIDNPIYSEVNHLIMLEELKNYNLEIIPVFHAGESFKVLDYMIEKGYKYIGISPNNNWREEEKRKWLTNVFCVYDFEKLGIKTHGFGYQSIEGLKIFPLSTADAISWKLAAGYGGIITPEGCVLYSDRSMGKFGHVGNIIGGDFEFVINLCNQLQIDINSLKTSYKNRCIFNVAAIDHLISTSKNKLSFMTDLFSDDIPFDEEKVQMVLNEVSRIDYKGYPESDTVPANKIQKRKSKQEVKEVLF